MRVLAPPGGGGGVGPAGDCGGEDWKIQLQDQEERSNRTIRDVLAQNRQS